MKRSEYHKHIDEIINFLDSEKSQNEDLLNKVQIKLDKLASESENDEHIGNDRYKLYQAQAMVCYRRYEDDLAIQWMEKAVETKGESFKYADEFICSINQNLQSNDEVSITKRPIRPLYLFLGGVLAIIVGKVVGGVLGVGIEVFGDIIVLSAIVTGIIGLIKRISKKHG